MSQEQETALQIVRTSNRIATADQLAAVMQTEPRFYALETGSRVAWLGQQIIALNYMVHSQKMPNEYDLFIESSTLDQAIMEDEGLRGLTQVEMQEAFRRGISGEYDKFYGITAPSLIGFLRAFRTCDKRMKAITILHSQEQQKLKAEDELFWKTLAEAKAEGKIELPEFPHSPFEDDKQRSKRLARQREEILKAQNNETEK